MPEAILTRADLRRAFPIGAAVRLTAAERRHYRRLPWSRIGWVRGYGRTGLAVRVRWDDVTRVQTWGIKVLERVSVYDDHEPVVPPL